MCFSVDPKQRNPIIFLNLSHSICGGLSPSANLSNNPYRKLNHFWPFPIIFQTSYLTLLNDGKIQIISFSKYLNKNETNYIALTFPREDSFSSGTYEKYHVGSDKTFPSPFYTEFDFDIRPIRILL